MDSAGLGKRLINYAYSVNSYKYDKNILQSVRSAFEQKIFC